MSCSHVDASAYTIGGVEGPSSGGGTTGEVYRMLYDEFSNDGIVTEFELMAQSAGDIVIAVSISLY